MVMILSQLLAHFTKTYEIDSSRTLHFLRPEGLCYPSRKTFVLEANRPELMGGVQSDSKRLLQLTNTSRGYNASQEQNIYILMHLIDGSIEPANHPSRESCTY